MPNFYLLRPDGTFTDFANYPAQPDDRDDGEWVAGEPTGLVLHIERAKTVETVINSINELINQGQKATVNNPLPLDRQEEIYDLVNRIENYLRKGAISLALSRTNAFDASEWEDIDAGQKMLLAGLKAQILTLLPQP